MNLEPFYSPSRFGWYFGGWGADYSIARAPAGGGYHIGLDIASTGDVPALVGGTVVRVRLQETQLGSVVVVQGDDGLYYSYCHLSKLRLPWVGQRVERGDRLGTLARGPRTLPASDPQYPGWAWFGIHLHLVVSTHPDSAYSYIPGHRTLAAFRDPDPIIRNILEEDDMFTDNDRRALGEVLTAATQAASRAADGEARNFSRVFLHEEGDYREWNFPAEWLPPLEGSPSVDGYRVTTDESEARRWHMASSAQRFARSSFRPVVVTKDEKHALQAQWRQNARDWRAAVALAVKGA